MGILFWHDAGLNNWARALVVPAKCEESGEQYEGPMNLGDKRPFYKYSLANGRVYVEKELDKRGTSLFTALQNESGEWVEESLWTESEIIESQVQHQMERQKKKPKFFFLRK